MKISVPFLPRNTFFIGFLSLLVLTSSAWSTVLVHWQGTDYVTARRALNLGTPVSADAGATSIYAYSAGTPIQPAANYTTPSGRSGIFYGGSYLTSTGSANTWSTTEAMITNNVNGDRIDYDKTPPAGEALSGMIFTAFLKNDFLNDGANQTIALDLNSTLTLGATATNNAAYRFAVLNDGIWYVSSSSATSSSGLSLSGSALLASTWGAWDPTGGLDGRLGSIPGTFATLGEDFTNIEGMGYVVSFSGTAGSRVLAGGVSNVYLDAKIIPEPTAVSLGMLGLGFVLLSSRRRFRRTRGS